MGGGGVGSPERSRTGPLTCVHIPSHGRQDSQSTRLRLRSRTCGLYHTLLGDAPSLRPLETEMEGEVVSLGFLKLGFGRVRDAIELEAV